MCRLLYEVLCATLRASVTSPDLGMIDLKPGTILKFIECVPDDQPKRQGWVWYEFEVIGRPLKQK